MLLRKMTTQDLPQVMQIIAEAQAFLRAQRVNQWQDGYPGEALIREDIAAGRGYVLAEGDQVRASAVVALYGEPTYDAIYEGAWTTPEQYACFHRTAVGAAYRGTGVADALIASCEAVAKAAGLYAVRIDTHRDNLVMQRMLSRNGYTRCGVIYLETGAARIALEKHLA
ncbi:MAG: GNAT family N-acetyltransferase [Oscillospiraceae bacterium]|jgi:GNAT superfamily N-acetyltransferase|nr:GNAT family N-acetyltransferase [Oscillospiraceae bacterium]